MVVNIVMDDIEVEVIVSKNHNDKFDNFKS